MMKDYLFLFVLISTGPLLATVPDNVSLEELVAASDHILTAKFKKIDIINELGIEITDPDANTGPGVGNIIRIHFTVDRVHFTNSFKMPKEVIVALSPLFHYSFKQVREIEEQSKDELRLLLLKGENFNAPFLGQFEASMSDKDEIFELKREQLREQNER